jgi:hypothetical protein
MVNDPPRQVMVDPSCDFQNSPVFGAGLFIVNRLVVSNAISEILDAQQLAVDQASICVRPARKILKCVVQSGVPKQPDAIAVRADVDELRPEPEVQSRHHVRRVDAFSGSRQAVRDFGDRCGEIKRRRAKATRSRATSSA